MRLAPGGDAAIVGRDLPRALVAAAPDALPVLGGLLEGLADIVPAESLEDARAALRRDISLVLCDVWFADARMLDFAQEIGALPLERQPPVVCVRLGGRLRPGAGKALGLALRELNVQGFVDLAAMRARHGAPTADEALRRLLRAHLGTSVAA